MAQENVIIVNEEKVKNKKKKRTQFFIQDFFNFILWAMFIGWKFGILKDFNVIQNIIMPNMKLVYIVTTILVLVVMVKTKRGFWKSIWLILKFYWRLLTFIPRLIKVFSGFIISILNYSGKIISLPTKIEVKLLVGLLSLFAIRFILVSTNSVFLYISMAILGVCIIVILHTMYSWTIHPLSILDITEKLLKKFWNWLIRTFVADKKEEMTDSEKKLLFTILSNGCELGSKTELEYSKSDMKIYLLKRFILLFTIFIMMTIIIFSLEYYAMHKLNGKFITGIESNYWEYLFFSFLTFLNMDYQTISLNIPIAKIIYVLQLFTPLYFLTIIILIFTSFTEEAAADKVFSFNHSLRNIKSEAVNLANIKLGIDENTLLTAQNLKDAEQIIEMNAAPTQEEP